MLATDTFGKFGRRIAATLGYPYIVIAETPNPIQDLGPDELYKRAEAMLGVVIDGLTLPPVEMERRVKDTLKQQIPAKSVVRSSVSI